MLTSNIDLGCGNSSPWKIFMYAYHKKRLNYLWLDTTFHMTTLQLGITESEQCESALA